jgi:ATP-dependent protease ClpP protease subunit
MVRSEKEVKERTEAVWGSVGSAPNKATEVVTSHNRIYFYTDVNNKNIMELNKQVNDLDVKNVSHGLTLGVDPAPIRVHLNSGGGSIMAGIAGMDNLRRAISPTESTIDGFCASAATFISIAAKTRTMTEHSFMLIHQLTAGFWGTYSNFEDEKKNLDLMMQQIEHIYNRYTMVPKKELRKILEHDLMWDSKKCLKMGLIDDIT